MKRPRRRTRVIGEFVLVVVGVLAALAVDRWATGAEEKSLERYYLGALWDDVRADSSSFQAERRRNRRALQQVEGLILSFGLELPPDPDAPTPPEPQLDFVIPTGVFYAMLDHEQRVFRSSFDELISTGRLGLVRDAGIRRELTRYYADIAYSARSISSRTAGSRTPLKEVALAASRDEVQAYPTRERSDPSSVNADAVRRAYQQVPGVEVALHAALHGLREERMIVQRKIDRNVQALTVLNAASR